MMAIATVVLCSIAFFAAVGLVLGGWVLAWLLGISIVVGGPLFFLAWWWAHTWPLHAWRRPGEPGALGLLWRRVIGHR